MVPHVFAALTVVNILILFGFFLALAGESFLEFAETPTQDRGVFFANRFDEKPKSRRRSSRAGSVPLDKQRAHDLLFRQKTFASVWHWLECLGITVRDRPDARQDVFLEAHKSFHTYNPLRGRPECWLNKITVHIANHYRERAMHRREELTPDDPINAVDPTPGPDEQLKREQARFLVLDRLQAVDAKLREVLVAHDLDGIPMVEIAEKLGIPVATAYKWRTRAMAQLAVALEQQRCEEDRSSALEAEWK
jgi:RNA polymerase sigma-70 factor, ECF subfamily